MDTCGSSGSVALAEDGAVVATEVLPGRSASERLVPVVRSLLEGHGWRLEELAAIVVVHGPGSFTGVRIGLSAAKGLSEAVAVPLVAVSRLEVLATLLPFARGAKEGAPGMWAVLDAGRGEFYLRDAGGAESLVTLAELRGVVGAGEVVVCEARVAEVLAGNPPFADGTKEGMPGLPRLALVGEPVAENALEIALERVRAGQFDDVATVDANYLRRTEGLFGSSKGL